MENLKENTNEYYTDCGNGILIEKNKNKQCNSEYDSWAIKLVEYSELEMTTIIRNEIMASFNSLIAAKSYAERNFNNYIIVPYKMNN